MKETTTYNTLQKKEDDVVHTRSPSFELRRTCAVDSNNQPKRRTKIHFPGEANQID